MINLVKNKNVSVPKQQYNLVVKIFHLYKVPFVNILIELVLKGHTVHTIINK